MAIEQARGDRPLDAAPGAPARGAGRRVRDAGRARAAARAAARQVVREAGVDVGAAARGGVPGRDRLLRRATTSRAATTSRSTGCATTARAVLHEALGDAGRGVDRAVVRARDARVAALRRVRRRRRPRCTPCGPAGCGWSSPRTGTSRCPRCWPTRGCCTWSTAWCRRRWRAPRSPTRGCSRPRSRWRAAPRARRSTSATRSRTTWPGAMAAGIAPALLPRGAAGDPPPRGVPSIRSLAELPAVLGAAGRMLGADDPGLPDGRPAAARRAAAAAARAGRAEVAVVARVRRARGRRRRVDGRRGLRLRRSRADGRSTTRPRGST